MKVSELVEKLLEKDQDLIVCAHDVSYGFDEIETVEEREERLGIFGVGKTKMVVLL